MMNFLSRHVDVERLIALVKGPESEAEKRRLVWKALDDATIEGGKEMTCLAGAAVLLAGGTLELTPAVLSQIPAMGGLVITIHEGSIQVTTEHDVASVILEAVAQAGGCRAGEPVRVPVGESPSQPEPETFPPASPEEPPNVALVRICEAVRLLIQRRYRGEIEVRGYAFMSAVFGELLSMAIGIELAHGDGEETIVKRLERLAGDMESRVLFYQTVCEHQQAATALEPDASTRNLSRLM